MSNSNSEILENVFLDNELNLSKDSNFSSKILDSTIPGIKEFNESDTTLGETSYTESQNPLQFLLSYELPIFSSTVLATTEEIDNSYDVASSIEDNGSTIEHADTNLSTQVIDSGVPNSYTNDYNGVEIKNGTDYTLTDDILNCDNLEINKSDIIIFHTHTCESYTPTETYPYEESGTFRTIDLNFSVARVGSNLSDQLLSYGYNVIHDKTYHDYPAYSGSYGRSQATVENLLLSHPDTDIIIDLHRDAIADTTYAPSVKIGDEVVSQLMFVIGTDGGGLEHPNWQNNLKFAIAVQQKANELYPGLFRPILLRNSRYNQQLGDAACIIEVGATGNTLEQSIASMKYFALVLNEVLK
ncbi:MAG: stage II sporulation protein P [Clostridia bacterium]